MDARRTFKCFTYRRGAFILSEGPLSCAARLIRAKFIIFIIIYNKTKRQTQTWECPHQVGDKPGAQLPDAGQPDWIVRVDCDSPSTRLMKLMKSSKRRCAWFWLPSDSARDVASAKSTSITSGRRLGPTLQDVLGCWLCPPQRKMGELPTALNRLWSKNRSTDVKEKNNI